ncbi:toxin TcdB middle/N-terminal domain-containing protein, partial [Streptosporangium carneum]
ARTAHRHLKRIRYGNLTPRTPDAHNDPDDQDEAGWLFDLVLDYGEHDDGPREVRPWTLRSDPFSSYRAGFEIRTYRLCRRIMLLHNFPDEAEIGSGCLVRSLDLGYDVQHPSGLTVLTSATRRGHRRGPRGGLVSRAMPPVEFSYAPAEFGDEVRTLDPAGGRNLPAGLFPPAYRWADLDGEGLSGVLTEQSGALFYKANLGEGRLGPMRPVARRPVPLSMGGVRQELLDLDGDGRLDLVALDGPAPGFSERADGSWTSWRPFRTRPVLDWSSPGVRLADLSGDGLADVIVLGDAELAWHPSLGEDGFGPASRARLPGDGFGPAGPAGDGSGPEDLDGPARDRPLHLLDPTESLQFADMTGDGLASLVRIRRSEICYWPSLGHGRFGPAVVMDGAPELDSPEAFDARRIILADLDGSGSSDLVYVAADGVRMYANRSGNGWAPARELPIRFPGVDAAVRVSAVDLLGSGTACLVWSSPLPGDAAAPLRYVDLMSAGKPHLLTGVRNNLGTETTIGYAPSTRFYLADREAGRPWAGRLPFPVHVVERVETRDLVARNLFTTRYAYHEGHYDGVEREFGGFALVEQWDSQEIGALSPAVGQARPANHDPAAFLPPVLTRSWFHTGTDEPAPPVALRRPGEPPRPWRLTPDERRQAGRALRGRLLRQEVYALDGTRAEGLPYGVTEHAYAVELRRPGHGSPRTEGYLPAVLTTHLARTREEHHERARYRMAGREVADPRTRDDFVLEVGEYGDVLRTVSAAYGRRHPDPDPALTDDDRAEQARTCVVVTEHRYTRAVDAESAYRTPLPCETRTSEVHGLLPADGDRFEAAELRAALGRVTVELPATAWNGPGPSDDPGRHGSGRPARRLLERERSLFWRDDLTGPLPFGALEPLGLPYETLRQVLTPDLLAAEYGDRVDGARLASAGYVEQDGAWWAPSGRVLFAPADGGPAAARFHLPHGFRDPFGATTLLDYDRYDLLAVATRDAVGNVVSVGAREGDRVLPGGYDYRVLQPRVSCDANGNLVEAAYDALGRLAATAVRGKPGGGPDDLGDSLADLVPDPDETDVLAYFADPDADASPSPRRAQDSPGGPAGRLLGRATNRALYDASAYFRSRDDASPRPPVSAVLSRTTHVAGQPPGEPVALQQTIVFSDGTGREVQHKVQAEPDADGRPRWVGTGWTVYNNKGLPVRRYEPFFSATHRFEFARESGVSSVVFYDPVGRAVATLHPDGGYDKVLFDPWRLVTWDVNDTVALRPDADPDVRGLVRGFLDGLRAAGRPWRTWYEMRASGGLGPAERQAAEQTLPHAGTPARAWTDALGRTFLTVRHNRTPDGDERHRTRVRLDVQGRPREVRDPLGRAVTRMGYDLTGGLITSAGVDSGPGLVLRDVLGAACASWTARGHAFRTEYDPLRRPVRSWVSGPGVDGEREHQRVEYGEGRPDAAARNLRTRIHRTRDGAGVVTHERYDADGNLVEAVRQIARDFREPPDWSGHVDLDPERYTGRVTFDALRRPVEVTALDGSTVVTGYNAAGLLERLEARLPGESAAVPVVVGVEYNARGQRVAVEHGNGVRTTHDYDESTFRLRRILTTRGDTRVQDLRYAYDPVGNVTSVRDDALQTLFFRNRVVPPGGRFVYDALYRLVEATGREHLAQVRGGQPRALPPTARGRAPRPHAHDGTAMSRYTERYAYDPVGNLLEIAHSVADAAAPGWTRSYRYDQESLLEPGRAGNRLGAVGDAPEDRLHHDEHGNVTALPGLPFLGWDPEDRLRVTSSGPPAEGLPRATWSSYDAAGVRIRKTTDRPGPDRERIRVSERLYIGPFEVYREFTPGGAVKVERTTLHVLDEERRVALVETRTRGDDKGPRLLVRHQFADHLGSPAVELDQDARVIGFEEFHPYGSTAYEAMNRRIRAAPKRYRYTGRERDRESGLQHHGARFYAPWLGRWISPDPAGPVESLSPYVYVAGNPMRLIDPGGAAGAEPRQLNLSETLRQEVIATRTGRGISAALRRDLQAVWEWWGGRGKVDAGHVGRAQWELRAGDRGMVAPQPAAENRALGALERVKAAAARIAKLFTRSAEGVDESAAAGARYGRATAAAWRKDPGFRAFLKTWVSDADKAVAPAASEAGAGA